MKNLKSKSKVNKKIEKNISKGKIFNYISLVVVMLSSIYLFYSYNDKVERFNSTLTNLNIKLNNFTYKSKSCFTINGCSLSKVSFILNDKKILIDKVLLSDKILEIFSSNFVDDKIGGTFLFNTVKIEDNNKSSEHEVPNANAIISASMIIKIGSFNDKNIMILDISFNKGDTASIKEENMIFKISLFGDTDKNITYRSWDSIPKIKQQRVLINKGFDSIITKFK